MTSTAVTNYTFNTSTIRVVDLDGNPWFVAGDVRKALGVVQSGSNFSFLGADEIRPIPRGLASGRGMNQASILSESGLYKFVLRSDKPQAREFQDWVTRVVLPAIRKDGAYIRDEDHGMEDRAGEGWYRQRYATIPSYLISQR